MTDENARLEAPTIDALADAICDILENPAEAERLRQGGLQRAATTDWEMEGRRMAEILRQISNELDGAATVSSPAAQA